MNPPICVPYWTGEASTPPVVSPLFIHLFVSDLTITTGTGSETWPDAELADGQANDSTVDWDYTPDGGYSKPAATGSTWVGQIGDMYGFSIGIPFVTPVAEQPFEAFSLIKLTASVTTGNYFTLFGVSGSLAAIRVRILCAAGPLLRLYAEIVEIANPFVVTTLGPYTIASGADNSLGIKVTPGVGSTGIELVYNGSTVDSDTVAYSFGDIVDATIQPSPGESAASATAFEWGGFTLDTL